MSNVIIKKEFFPSNLRMTTIPFEPIGENDENKEIKLRKDGQQKLTANHKQSGKKSEVYAFEVEDLKKMTDYFEANEMWIHNFIFVVSCNMARRINDTLSLKWDNFYNPETGSLRSDIKEIKEDKTDKLANPHINSAVRKAIADYCEKTGCNPSENNYQNPVFLQLSGPYKGKVISDEGYMKQLKGAAKKVGIEYNVGTHSPRKTFGMISRMLHPSDYDSMELLQTIYNHSDTKTTKHYIGLTKQKVNQYYDDFGNFFDDYVTGGKEFETVAEKPVVSLDVNDLRDLLKKAIEIGIKSKEAENTMAVVDGMNELLAIVDEIKK